MRGRLAVASILLILVACGVRKPSGTGGGGGRGSLSGGRSGSGGADGAVGGTATTVDGGSKGGSAAASGGAGASIAGLGASAGGVATSTGGVGGVGGFGGSASGCPSFVPPTGLQSMACSVPWAQCQHDLERCTCQQSRGGSAWTCVPVCPPAQPITGGACYGSLTNCIYGDTGCSCAGPQPEVGRTPEGTWTCGPAVCPSVPPANGNPCYRNGLCVVSTFWCNCQRVDFKTPAWSCIDMADAATDSP
jgi:hypothetical protein